MEIEFLAQDWAIPAGIAILIAYFVYANLTEKPDDHVENIDKNLNKTTDE